MQVVLSVMKPGLEMEAAKEAAKEGGAGQMLVFGWRVVAPEGGPELPPPMLVREVGALPVIEGEAEEVTRE
jgi:hypothetical protein